MLNPQEHIEKYFIDLDINNIPLSLFLVRKSIFRAVNVLKDKIHGDVLDLGCGHMPYKNILITDKVKSYVGLDLPPTIYHHEVKPDLFWDAITIPASDNQFDFVIATEFFEHYFDTDHILREIKRVLKPGGILFFTVPTLWPVHEEPYDYHRFTNYSLEKHFLNNRFSDFKISPLGDFKYSLAMMISLYADHVLKGRRKKLFYPLIKRLIKILIKNANTDYKIGNGKMHSGLYGFVTK